MSKLLNKLLESVNREDIIDYAEGVNGLIAVTKNQVYLQRGKLLERKILKSYAIKSITSIQTKKPALFTNGHMQIIASGSGDRTKRFSSSFNYATDENTVMIREEFENFQRIEQLIYKLQSDQTSHAAPKESTQEDPIAKIEKLNKLKESGIISEEEFESKKKQLLELI